jgi:RNA polymerase primary sigma factor
MARAHTGPGLSVEDMVHEGVIGLIRAFGRFDPERGLRFATYAKWWVRSAIQRAVADTGRAIRLPCSTLAERRRIEKVRRRFRVRKGRTPTRRELQARTGIHPDRQQDIEGDATRLLLSLDFPLMGEEGGSMLELIADEHVPPPDGSVAEEDRMERIRAALECLGKREEDIVRKRFGLDGESGLTLQAIGDAYDLSRERVRQIQDRALGRMRARLQAGA